MESPKTATSRKVSEFRVRALLRALLGLGALAALLPAPARAANDSAARASVITVRVTGQEWNWKTPWSKQSPWARTVTGLVVEGPAILVATPSLGNHLLLEVQKRGEDLRTPARLVLSDPEGPLALLAVDDAAFWKGLAPLPIAESVVPEGEVTVNRWVRSGQFESSRATLRQVRATRHGLSRTSLLTLEAASSLDGAGDSEVLVKDGSVVGLATSKQGETLAAISAPVLRQFLADARNPPYRGFARAGIAWQDLTNPALRSYLGLVEDEAGVRLTRVLPHGSGAGILEPGDVILEVAGHKIDPTGNFEHPVYGRLLFPVLFTDGARPGDSLRVKILRQGERSEVDMPLRRMAADDDKVPPYVHGRGPDYAVSGGLVFQELTVPYLATWGDWARRAPTRLLVAYDREGAEPTPETPRIVLLSSVLPDPCNLGYQDLRDLIVTAVNGIRVGRLDDLRRAFAEPKDGFHIVEFIPGQGPTRIVLSAAEVDAAAVRIRTLYGAGD
jgi:PDZ domain